MSRTRHVRAQGVVLAYLSWSTLLSTRCCCVRRTGEPYGRGYCVCRSGEEAPGLPTRLERVAGIESRASSRPSCLVLGNFVPKVLVSRNRVRVRSSAQVLRMLEDPPDLPTRLGCV